MLELNVSHIQDELSSPSRNSGFDSARSNPKPSLNFIITKPNNRPRRSGEREQLQLTVPLTVPLDLLSTSVIQDSKSEILSKPMTTEISSPAKSFCDGSPDCSPTIRIAKSGRRIELDSKKRHSIENDFMGMIVMQQDDEEEKEEEKSPHQEESNKIIVHPVVQEKTSAIKKVNKIQKFLKNRWITAVIAIFNLYALYGDDLRLLLFRKSADPAFGALTIITIAFFLAEITLNLISIPKYRWSFFFFLEIVSTLSLIFDIPWINEAVFYPDPRKNTQTALADLGKAGQKAATALRVFRLVRFFRVGKIYKELLRLKHQYDINRAIKKEKKRIEEQKQREYKQRVLETFRKFGNRRRRVAPLTMAQMQSIYEGKIELPSGFLNNIRKRDSLSIIRQKEQAAGGRRDSLNGLIQNRASSILSNKSGGSSIDAGSGGSTSLSSPARNSISSDVVYSPEGSASKFQYLKSDHPLKHMKVGGKLSDLTTKRLIFMVILMLMLSPAFERDYYIHYQSAGTFATDVFAQASTGDVDKTQLRKIYDASIADLASRQNPLIYFKVPQFEPAWESNVDPSSLRNSELNIFSWSKDDDKTPDVLIITDQRIFIRFDAGLRMAWTTFICIVFFLAQVSFSGVINDLLLRPLDAMIQKVNALAQNPLSWKNMLEEDRQDTLETVTVTNSIVKMSALLSLSFGKVGTEILLRNVQQMDEIDVFKQGSKRLGLFGYCGLRNFSELTASLDEDVVSFVNVLAKIIHGKTVKYKGSPGSLFREAFSVVWNFLENDHVIMKEGNLALKMSRRAINTCNLAVIAFLKIYIRLLRGIEFQKRSTQSAPQEKPQKLKVNIGMGLHFGWAIEGVVGSEYKIDPCYLSPHINVAFQLEAATKIYGVPLLLSGRLHSKCSDSLKKLLRRIDRVALKGTTEIIDLYTIDMDLTKLPPKRENEETEAQKAGRKKLREDLIKRIADGKGRIETILNSDTDLYEITKDSGEGQFTATWNETMEAYLKGEWLRTKRLLGECQALRPHDEPCKALYNYLSRYSFLSPLKWPGHRDLKEDLI